MCTVVLGCGGTVRWNQELLQRKKVTQFGLSSDGNVCSVLVQQREGELLCAEAGGGEVGHAAAGPVPSAGVVTERQSAKP